MLHKNLSIPKVWYTAEISAVKNPLHSKVSARLPTHVTSHGLGDYILFCIKHFIDAATLATASALIQRTLLQLGDSQSL